MSQQTLPVALDAMGGDHAPEATVEGAVAACTHEGRSVILVGDESAIMAEIRKHNAEHFLESGRLQIVHASETISMDDKPAQVMRKKRDSSMHVACELVKEGLACGALSAGNSGAMMAVALVVIGRIPGVSRPAIAAVMPTVTGQVIVVDAGANTECLPNYLFQFALMGNVYVQQICHIETPRVAVLANGEEDSKGTDLTRKSLELIRATSLNCVGYCEGRDVLQGEVDVVVCDGFVGNILLKTAEGTASFFVKLLKQAFEEADIVGKLGGLLSRSIFSDLKKRVDPREFGAAPLLGLPAPVFIAHGSSDAYAIHKAIGRVHQASAHQLTEKMAESIAQWAHVLEP